MVHDGRPLPAGVESIYVGVSPHVLCAATLRGVYRSDDGGAAWHDWQGIRSATAGPGLVAGP